MVDAFYPVKSATGWWPLSFRGSGADVEIVKRTNLSVWRMFLVRNSYAGFRGGSQW